MHTTNIKVNVYETPFVRTLQALKPPLILLVLYMAVFNTILIFNLAKSEGNNNDNYQKEGWRNFFLDYLILRRLSHDYDLIRVKNSVTVSFYLT